MIDDDLDKSQPDKIEQNEPLQPTQAAEKYESIHGTNDYITSWDAIFSEPSDVYVNGYDMFETGEGYFR